MSVNERSEAAALRQRGQLEEAEALLARAVTATPGLFHDLAVIQYDRRDFASCERSLDNLVALAPAGTSLDAYRLLAKVKAARVGPEAAREVMHRAMLAHGGRTEFVAAYADTLPPDEAIAVLEQHLIEVRKDPSRVAYLLLRITTLRAPLIRRAKGLPVHGTSWPDTVHWPDHEALPGLKDALLAEIAIGSKRATARLTLAFLAIAEGDWETAEKYLAELREGPKRTSADFMAFGAAFHAGLDAMSDADIVKGLVPVHRIASVSLASETLFMASDLAYFTTFTLPFVRQLDTMKAREHVHVHLLDGNEAEWVSARDSLGRIAVTLTAEASGAAAQGKTYARNYYHAVRYVRFFEELKRSRKPMWMLDCDVQLLRDPRPLFSSLASRDLALRASPSYFDPISKITASCVGVAPTPLGLEFARRVASAIIHWKDRGTWSWGVDQLSLFSAYAHMHEQGRTPNTLFLDDMAMNDKFGDTGAIRFMSGMDKFLVGAHA